MQSIKSDFKTIFIDIISREDYDDGDNKINISEMTTFENRWFDAFRKLQNLASSLTPDSPSKSNKRNGNDDNSLTNVRRPVINLPKFSALYKDWLPFYDAFRSLIHKNTTLSECQKFHYLKSCLKGETSRSIEPLTMSDANYATAWSLL